ncbi:MAG: glycosyltransferase family 4 protein [Patescibacteria group bacterium]
MENKIPKTLLISTYFLPQIGGAENYLYNVYSRLEPENIFVLTQTKNKISEADFDHQQKFTIWRTDFFDGKFKPTWWPLIKKVKKIILENKIETLHFGHYAHYIFLVRWLKMPYVVYFHGTDLDNYSQSFFGQLLMKYNITESCRIIVGSNFLKNKLLKIYNQPEKIEVINPGLNLSEFEIVETRDQLREQFKIGNNTKVILSVGHLNYSKGFDLGIEAVRNLIQAGHQIKYFILGAGSEKENLQKMIGDFGLDKQIFLIGEISDRQEYAKYFKIADLYLGPSRNEGFGIVFLEAQVNNLPIVAYRVGGIEEAVGENVVFSKSLSVEDLQKAILKGLQLEVKKVEVGQFDWGQKLAKFRKILYNA